MKRLHPGGAGGVDHRRGAADIDRLEAGAVGRVDQAGDVDHRVGAVGERGQAVGPVERALDPVDPLLGRAPAAGQRADRDARRRARRGADAPPTKPVPPVTARRGGRRLTAATNPPRFASRPPRLIGAARR